MIKFYVNEQNIELKTNRVIASDTINFVKLDFVFCENWDGYNKTIQFTQQTNTYSVNIGVDGTTCYLPNEITDGLCAISVFGNKDDKRATTIPYQVRINRSGFIEDSIIPSDTPLTTIEQLIQDTKNLKDNVSGLKTDVSGLKTDVNSLKTGVNGLKTDVSSLKTDVGNLKTNVNSLQTNVNSLQTDVGGLKTDVSGLKTDINSLKESVAVIPKSNQNRLADAFDMQFGNGYHGGGLDVYYDKETNTLTINGTTTTEQIAGAGGYNRRVYLDMGCYEFVDCPTGNIFEDGYTSQLPFKLSFNPYINENVPIEKYAVMTDKTTAAAQPNQYNKLKRDCCGTMTLIIPAGSSFNNQTFHPYLTRYSASIE